MKKRMLSMILAVVMCLSVLPVSAFAAESDCTENHKPPTGYTYYKAAHGNTDQEVFVLTYVAGKCAVLFPDYAVQISVSTNLYNLLYLWNPTGEGRGDYVKYIYYQKSSSGFWEHTLFYTTNLNGEQVYLGCTTNRYWVSNDCEEVD
jgi:hypothetical protein